MVPKISVAKPNSLLLVSLPKLFSICLENYAIMSVVKFYCCQNTFCFVFYFTFFPTSQSFPPDNLPASNFKSFGRDTEKYSLNISA